MVTFALAPLVTSNSRKLDPYFITGFADAEGCFYIRINQDNKYLNGYQVQVSFKIGLDKKDRAY